jgi:UDP-N-acetylmuramoyl-tripeptide--D-alanyl-D-alanine ligase
MAKGLKSSVLSFGYTENADVHAVDLERQGSVDDLPGVKFKLLYDGSAVPVFLPRVLGQHQTYAALAAAAIGIAMKLNLIDIANGLQSYIAPKGRMNLVPGINNSLIVDDTYNSSPEAAMAAVKAIAELNLDNATRKVAIMGDMLELGDITDQAHYDLGRTVAESKFDILVAVGINRLATIRGAQEAGMENFLDFENSIIAAEKMKELIVGHEVILVKGSQGSRMERVVKSLMREPERAKELLVRQSDEWLKK